MSKRIYFSTDGIDWYDDDAVRAFAEKAWEVSVQEFTGKAVEPVVNGDDDCGDGNGGSNNDTKRRQTQQSNMNPT